MNSNDRYEDVSKRMMNDRQRKVIVNLYMQADNHDNHAWVTFEDVLDAVANIMEAGQYSGMLTKEESADATILNLRGWDFDDNGKYPIDSENGRALVDEYIRLKTENTQLRKRIEANKFLGRGSL